MITTNFVVKKRKISQINSIPFTGEYNIDTFKFEFDEEWEGLDKTLVIVTDETYNVALLNDECVVPMEFYDKKGEVKIGLFGSSGNEKILATGWCSIYPEDDAYKRGQEPSNLPTPTQWDLYVAEINRLLEACQASQEQCEDIAEQLARDYQDYLDELTEIRDEASEILDNVEQVRQDIIDMGATRMFATFYLDASTGRLYVVGAESLGNMNFFIQDSKLYVNIITEV